MGVRKSRGIIRRSMNGAAETKEAGHSWGAIMILTFHLSNLRFFFLFSPYSLANLLYVSAYSQAN
ncbi:hypothetical protein RvY_07109 [Ramazzottius varieornatus]|uniref:Uncharacterized protein n=1 Tax=Ramazzottius varieornatus TaxID=947166 RepID=A0A1D1V0W9_RAMVA|nr:hypothetical protein RvY_07109 [Ramazzottius varieornatus]